MEKKEVFMLLLFLILLSCKKEEEYLPTLDRPTYFQATKGDYVEKIVLSWTIPPQANTFEVFRFDSIQNGYFKIGESTNNSYTDSSISKANKKYYYKVRVYNSKSKFSNYSDIDYGYLSTFSKPNNVTASQGLNDEFISLNWPNVLGASEYSIYKSTSINGNFEFLGKTQSNSYNDNNINPIIEYFYKIKAYNSSLGYSDYSDIVKGYKLQKYSLISSFGTYGMGTGQLSHPIGVVVDKNDNIYISENWDSRRVQKFDSNGNFLSTITTDDNPYGILYFQDSLFISKNTTGKVYCFNMSGQILYDWGNGYGASSDQFRGAWSMVFDDVHNMYIVDRDNNRIKKYNAKKELISIWTGFDNPYGLLYINGEILISDNNGLNKYTLDGVFKSKVDFTGSVSFITKDNSNNIYLANSTQIVKMDSQYRIIAKFGNFQWAYSVCINSVNNVIVSDLSANKIYKYSPIN